MSFIHSQTNLWNFLKEPSDDDGADGTAPPVDSDYTGTTYSLRSLEFANFKINGTYFSENNTYYMYQNDTIVIEVQVGPDAGFVDLGLKHETFPTGNEFNFTMTRDTFQSFAGDPSGTSYVYNWTLKMDGTNQTGPYQCNFTAHGPTVDRYKAFYFEIRLLNPSPVIKNVTIVDPHHSSPVTILEGDSFETFRDQQLDFTAYMYDIDGKQFFPSLDLNYSKNSGDPTNASEQIQLTYQDAAIDESGMNTSRFTGSLTTTLDVNNPTTWAPNTYTFNLTVNDTYNDMDGQGNKYSYYSFVFAVKVVNLPPNITEYFASPNLIDPTTWSGKQWHNVSVYINASDLEDDRVYYKNSNMRYREYMRTPYYVGLDNMERLTNPFENLTNNIRTADGSLVEANSSINGASNSNPSYLYFPIRLDDVNTQKLVDDGKPFNITIWCMINQTTLAGGRDGVQLQVKRMEQDVWDTWAEVGGTNISSSPGTWRELTFRSNEFPQGGQLQKYAGPYNYYLYARLQFWDQDEEVYAAIDTANFTYSTETRETFGALALQVWGPTRSDPETHVINEWWDDSLKLWNYTIMFDRGIPAGAYTLRLIALDHGKLGYIDPAEVETQSYDSYYHMYKTQTMGIAEVTRTIILNQNKKDAINASDVAAHFHPKPEFNRTDGTLPGDEDLNITMVVQDEKLSDIYSGQPSLVTNYTGLMFNETFQKYDGVTSQWETPSGAEVQQGDTSYMSAPDGNVYEFTLSADQSTHYDNSSIRMDFQFNLPWWVSKENLSFFQFGIGAYISRDENNDLEWDGSVTGSDGVNFKYWDWETSSWQFLPREPGPDVYYNYFSSILANDAPDNFIHWENISFWNNSLIGKILNDNWQCSLKIDVVDEDQTPGTSAPGEFRMTIDCWNVSLGVANDLGGRLYVHNEFDPEEGVGSTSSSVYYFTRTSYDDVNDVSYWTTTIPTSTFNSGNYTFHAYLQNSNSCTWFFGARYMNWEEPFYNLVDELANTSMYRNQTFQIIPHGLTCTIDLLGSNRMYRREVFQTFLVQGTLSTPGNYGSSNFKLQFKYLSGDSSGTIIRDGGTTYPFYWDIPSGATTPTTWKANATFQVNPFRAGRYVFRAIFTNNDTTENTVGTVWQEIRIINDPPKFLIVNQQGGVVRRVVDKADLTVRVYDNDNKLDDDNYQPRLEMELQDRKNGDAFVTAVVWQGTVSQRTQATGYFLYDDQDNTVVTFPAWVLARKYNESRFVLQDNDADQPQLSVYRTNRTEYDVKDVLPAFQLMKLSIDGTGTEYDDPIVGIDLYRNHNFKLMVNMTDADDPWEGDMNVTGVLHYTVQSSDETFTNSSFTYDDTNNYFFMYYYVSRTKATGLYQLTITFTDPEGNSTSTSPAFNINILNNLPVLHGVNFSKDGTNFVEAPLTGTYSPDDFKIFRGNETLYVDAWVYDEEDSWVAFKMQSVTLRLTHKNTAATDFVPIDIGFTHDSTDGSTHIEYWRASTVLPINTTFFAGNLTASLIATDTDGAATSSDRNLKVRDDPPKLIKYTVDENITLSETGYLNLTVWATDYEGLRSIAVKFRLDMPSVTDYKTVKVTSASWVKSSTDNSYRFNVTLVGDLLDIDTYEYLTALKIVQISARDYDYGRIQGGKANNEIGELGNPEDVANVEISITIIHPAGGGGTWDPLYTWLIIGVVGAVAGVGFGYWFWKNKVSYRKYL
ncbi:MAG: hypothetical protein ACTSU5_03495 [Promethearchaeota archaeon]